MKTTLVIMAAGIGSRFGGGIKQLQSVGPNGEIIMDYSIKDAVAAGFDRVVFIIRKDLEKDFKEIIGNRIEKEVEVAYAFQELDDLPNGFKKPEGRVKPWGTGQAILVCKDIVKEPFVVINADDYYGKEAFVKVHDFLVADRPESEKMQICMAGFILGNTLSDHGSVTRGICRLGENRELIGIKETHDIIKTCQGAAVTAGDGTRIPVDVNSLVSMNMWGLTPEFLEELETGFKEFLENLKPGELKKEYLLPEVVDDLIQRKKAEVVVLKTHDTWFGVTYQEDRQTVVEAFAKLVEEGVYKRNLYE